ncbi:dienelactone hydrolase family protein [Serpens gallinarum]|uniref:Dienelactone hydrolase family protein n=1 Tax=Serpens gallinarum TaxID=2763075 RepID=A0ABR8TRN2_9PSED|nr:dienelactone hydrolase family protein [Serpens gallinarum]MBD7978135.1 dienelactone hydrolase family protein [Serpens gallinarum]
MRPFLPSLLIMSSSLVQADIQTREIPYQSADGTQLLAYYAYDDAAQTPRPGVLVVHEWWGLNDYTKRRARDLAALGYTALAIDMYGEGKNTRHPADAKAFMQAAAENAQSGKARFLAGLELLKQQPQTDASRLAAIGYCFGGKVVLDMARQGVPLAGVVSFHGNLSPAVPASPGSIKARILVEHGEADSMVGPEQVKAFKAEMDQAGADYRFVSLPGAKHAFSNPDADAYQAQGLDLAYQKQADERSWSDMQAFFEKLFGE